MDKGQLEQIAQRQTCCKPFGESVSLSRVERDELVAIARKLDVALDLLKDSSSVCGAVIRAGQDNTGAIRNHQIWVDSFLSENATLAKEGA